MDTEDKAFLIIGIIFCTYIMILGMVLMFINLVLGLITILFCVIGLYYTVSGYKNTTISDTEINYLFWIAPIAWLITSNVLLFSLGYNFSDTHMFVPIWLTSSLFWYVIPMARSIVYRRIKKSKEERETKERREREEREIKERREREEREEREIKERREREEEERKKRREQEKNDYDNIPNLKDLIRSYVYSQMVVLQNEFKNIQIETLDNKVRNHLNSKIDEFVKYLKMEGHPLTQYQTELLKVDCFKVSEPIRNELRILIQEHVEEERIRKKREEQERLIKEKAKMTKELFGKEIIKEEDIQKVEEYITIYDKIDDLLKGFKDWEYTKEGKKEE